jgi:trigger factor
VKITREKLPKSRVALDIELEPSQVEKGLDRAAKRISEKHHIPGFRKGKVPRFIIERYFGREQLLQEATGELIKKAFNDAIKEESIVVAGTPSVESITSTDPFQFRVVVPIPPTVVIPDYHTFRFPLEIEPVTDELVEQQMEALREKHSVLKELETPRPAQDGDLLTVAFRQTIVDQPQASDSDDETPQASNSDDEAPQASDSDDEEQEATLELDQERLLPAFYNGLLGVTIGEQREISTVIGDDSPDEELRGNLVDFTIKVLNIQERVLPNWEDLPTLEKFEGTLDAMREQMHQHMELQMRHHAERKLLDQFLGVMMEQSEFDIPDTIIEQMANNFLDEQVQQYQQHGIDLEQMLQQQGKSRDDVIQEMLPEAEKQVQSSLMLQEVIQREHLNVSEQEVQHEIAAVLHHYQGDIHDFEDKAVAHQMLQQIAQEMISRKLNERLIAIATGQASTLEDGAGERNGVAEEGEPGEPEADDDAAHTLQPAE